LGENNICPRCKRVLKYLEDEAKRKAAEEAENNN
jgi:hypothetical protein